MGKGIKKTIKILVFVATLLVALPTSIWLAFQDSRIQTLLLTKATQILEERFNTTVRIQKIDFRPFNRILLLDVYVQDLNGDTLLYADKVTAYLTRFSTSNRIISLNRANVEGAQLNLLSDSTGVMNISAFIQSFRKEKMDREKPAPFTIEIKSAGFAQTTFRLKNYQADSLEFGINFKDMLLTNIRANVKNFKIVGDTIGFTVQRISFEEQSGFSVDHLRMDMKFCSKFMYFDKLQISAMGYNINMPHMHLDYGSWEDMKDFVNLVNMSGSFTNTTASTGLIAYFAPTLRQVDQRFSLTGSFRGTVSDLRLREIMLHTANRTMLKLNANLTGLPDFKNTLLFFDIKQLNTHVDDLESVKNSITGKTLIKLPDIAHSLKSLQYTGSFTGFISDFVAYGAINSAIGQVFVDISVKPQEASLSGISGKISTDGLDLGKLIGNDILGKTTLEATLKGKTDYAHHFAAETNAFISSFEAKGYKYSNIEINGEGTNRSFIGSLSLDDPNAKLNFMGTIDATDSIPVFDFSAFVSKLDLVKLNLNKKDSLAQASFLLTANFVGNSIDNTRGEVKMISGFYKNEHGELKTSDITLSANNTPESKLVSLSSEFAEGELRGKYSYTNIFSSLKELAFLYLPALSADNQKPEIRSTGVEDPEFNDYIIKLRLKKTAKFTDVFSPNFSIAENTNVFGIYNPDFQTLSLKVSIPEMSLSGNTVKNILIDGNTKDSLFVAHISSPYVQSGSSFIRNLSIKAEASHNTIYSAIGWDNKSKVRNEGKIESFTRVEHMLNHSLVEVNIMPSVFYLNDTLWNVERSGIVIDTSQIAVHDFAISNNDQSLRISGVIASLPSDSIDVRLQNIDLSNTNFYTQSLGYNLSGKVNGYAKVLDIKGTPLFFSDLVMSGVQLNNQLLGDVDIHSQWVADENRLNLKVYNSHQGESLMTIAGDVYPQSKKIDLAATIDKFFISHIEPLMVGQVTGVDGYVAGDVTLKGTLNQPKLNGVIHVVDGAASVGFTQTRYRLTDPIYLDDSNVIFDGFKLMDMNNRLAVLNGTIYTNYFKDIRLDLSLLPSNFQFLNTTERDNDQFYGTVFATGQVRVIGAPSNLAVTASVRTDQRTALFLPLASSGKISESDFVNIVDRSNNLIIIDEVFEAAELKPKANVSLTLDMQVTPDAEVQIIIDKQMGDIIRANGSGDLKLEINPSQKTFNMFGQYGIENGDYLFTLQGVINKRFKIGQGSTITWNGDLTDALMDINAIYSLRTTLSSLSPDSEDEVFKRRTQVDCHINLTGKLMEPTIGFDIKVPLAETHESINAVFQDAINTEERLSRQFLSLLVVNSFTSDVQLNNMGGFGQQGFATTAGEMISNQMSNWLSQISNTIDIGFNWKPGDEISSDEIELAFSTQLFNDRVTINSNVDYGNQNVNAPLAGDFSVDVKILPSGKLRAKAFVRSNDDILMGEHQGDLTTGAGFMYREEFNTFAGLWRKYVNFFRRRSKEEEVTPTPELDTLGIGRYDPMNVKKTLSHIK